MRPLAVNRYDACMEIVGDSAHRVLAYIEAMNRQGCPLTRAQVNAYAEGWAPIRTITGASAYRLYLEDLDSMEQDTVTETMTAYLLRLGWINFKDVNLVTPTRLGLAVLREANSPQPDSDAGSTLEIVIDPSNPFAYAQLMAKITSLGDCLIVDPYLDEQQLLTIARFTNVTRVLTGDKNLKAKGPVFGLVLQAAQHLEVRTVKQGELHDRFAIPAHGSVYMLGSSLNSIAKRFGVATTLEESSSRLISDNYQTIWGRGQAIPRREFQAPSPTPKDPAAAIVDDETLGMGARQAR